MRVRRKVAFGEYAGQTTQAVVAEQLEEDRSIITPRGIVEGKAGDWEVRHADGNVERMSDEEWQAMGASAAPAKEGNGSEEGPPDKDRTTEDTSGESDPEADADTPEKSRDRPKKKDDELF
jgi:hypothetical protein